MTDVREREIISKYLREIQPILNEMEKILMISIPSIIFDKSGKIKRVYDDETQNKIDMLNTHINLVADNYRSQYPELFRYNN
jgi:hypothetical protein